MHGIVKREVVAYLGPRSGIEGPGDQVALRQSARLRWAVAAYRSSGLRRLGDQERLGDLPGRQSTTAPATTVPAPTDGVRDG